MFYQIKFYFSLFQVKKDHCLRDLDALLVAPGVYEQKLEEDLDLNTLEFKAKQEDGTERRHDVTGCPADHIRNAKNKFIQNLKENIKAR